MANKAGWGPYTDLGVLKVLVRVPVPHEPGDRDWHAGHLPLALAGRGVMVRISRDQRRVGAFVRVVGGAAAEMVLEAWLGVVGGQLDQLGASGPRS